MTIRHVEPIDAVYTWVDGDDPEFRRTMRRHLDDTRDGSSAPEPPACQYRDNQELRFSIRSLEKHAPWLRRIYVMTNGQTPSWLETNHPRLRLIHHSDIFLDPEDLPTFNSNAIELQLHRIPGLSKRFLYLNDDLFLCQPIHREDYVLKDDSQIYYFDRVHLHRDPDDGTVHDRAYAFSRYTVMNDCPGVGRQLLPAHCPQLYDREVLQALEGMYQDAFRKGPAHRFRHPEDVVIRILYSTTLFKTDRAGTGHRAKLLRPESSAYGFLMLPSRVALWRAIGRLIRRQPKYLCINNDLAPAKRHRMTLLLVRMTLRYLFPHPSSFER